MNLAARCPACGTVFRVVQDQLRVSDGWVRCGRCAEVFNAIETLVDLEADIAERPPTSSRGRERVMEDLARLTGAEAPEVDDGARSSGQAHLTDRVGDAPGDQVPPSTSPQPEAAAAEPALEGRHAGPDRRPASPEPPAFIRRAERAARWQRPGVRASLMAAIALGGLSLAVQAAVEYRDLAVARWPALGPALEQACAIVGCRIEAPRSIEALTVESSGLVRIEGTPLYRLSVVLRNRAPLPLASPALDLTLTDSQGGIIARRVFELAALGVRAASIPALTELPLQATLGIADGTINGYTIEIFYP